MYKYKKLFVGLQLNSYIYTFGMEISEKGMEDLFVNNMMLKFLFKKKGYEKKAFPYIFTWESIKMIPI
jgi:hypothetical protein